ncbi:hypothetical protein RRG08_003632 [Elysia crispata]|uniref:Elongation of very long chain fatty acids protein n=1 Tax=Elysia crispata TaxID=231223 RepID=A0AAE1AVI7_9GAST|nr:hypothetical protein RRG08_003632 [Elysia crispata]
MGSSIDSPPFMNAFLQIESFFTVLQVVREMRLWQRRSSEVPHDAVATLASRALTGLRPFHNRSAPREGVTESTGDGEKMVANDYNYTVGRLSPLPFDPSFVMPKFILWDWTNTIFFTRRDVRMMDFFLIEPVHVNIAIALTYLAIVAVGPILMRPFKPFVLKWPLIIYNFCMVAVSIYMLCEVIYTAYISNYTMFCQPVDFSRHPLAMRMARLVWLYFFTRYVEFLDTIFFILRKKNNQLSFLHVYHHVTIAGTWWVAANVAPGGMMVHLLTLNCFIHTIMYSYYGLSALGPHMQKYLWWKRHLTKLQLIQFCCMLIIMGTNTTCNDPNFPQFLNYIGVVYCITILSLFTNFYIQSYLKNKTTKKSVDQNKTSGKHLPNGGQLKFSPNGSLKSEENGNHSEANGSASKKKHPHSE